MNVRAIIRATGKWCKNNAGKIFAGCAIVTEFLGFWFMHKEAPIARDRLDALPEDAKWLDKVKAAGPVYLPALGMLVLSTGSIVGGCVAGERKAAILTSLYTASEAALRKYERKVVDTIGREKAQEIQDSIAKEYIAENPPYVNGSKIYATGNGDKLIFDPLSGRYFTSEPAKVIAAMNKMNRRIISEMWVSVNEWYQELGLEPVGLGDDKGWNNDHMIDIPDEVDVWSTTQSPDNVPCFIITYYNRPVMYKKNG